MQERFPTQWKFSKIIPLHKKNDTLSVENYRPVSILSPLSKVLERIIYDQVYHYVTRNKILHKNMHGFRKNRSSLTAFLQLYDKWVKAANDGNVSGAILIDLSAAFDWVSPDIPIKKL